MRGLFVFNELARSSVARYQIKATDYMNYMDVFSYNDLRNLWQTGITLPRITQMHK